MSIVIGGVSFKADPEVVELVYQCTKELDELRHRLGAAQDDADSANEQLRKVKNDLRDARNLLGEIWMTIPATHDPKDSTVQRHASVLNKIQEILDNPSAKVAQE